MNVRTQFDLFLDEIRPHILDYLESKGYNTRKPIHCINPHHDDSTPSMLCSQAADRGWTISCRGCGANYDIFNVYSILEDTPPSGPMWISQTVVPLAKRFGIDAPVVELTSEQQFCQDLYRIYEDVASLLNHNIDRMDPAPKAYVRQKEWTQETLEALDVGTVSYETICERIDPAQAARFGLDKPEVFSPNNLIFTIRDRFGRPIRFFARQPEGSERKFNSTPSASLTVNLWSDRGRLYGAHLIGSQTPATILVEGQPDVVTMHQNGIRGVGLCGCESFSQHHADALALMGVSRLVTILDGDKPGLTAMQKMLEKDFAKREGLHYEVIILPDNHDPDSYIREEGIEAFKFLLSEMRLSAFEFLLSRRDPSDPIEKIVEELVPHIAANRSEILREKMAIELSTFLDKRISVGSILSDVRHIDHVSATATMERRKSIIAASSRMAGQNINEAEEVFRTAIEQLQEVEKTGSSGIDARNKVLSRIQATKTMEERRIAGGFEVTDGRMTNLAEILAGGSWTGRRLIIVGAIENMGKSSFLDDLMWQIVSNPDNNAIGYWLTLDDGTDDRQRRLQCCALGKPEFTMNMISNPHYYAEELGVPKVYEMRERSYALLTEQVAAGRIILEGSQDGTTVSYAIKRLQQIRRDNPESNIVFCLDNLHDVDDWPSLDQRQRVTNIIKTIRKRIVDGLRVTAICAAEYRKGDPTKPGCDEDLADARALKFAPHLTIHLFSDLGVAGIDQDEAIMVHHYGGDIRPRVIAAIGKNKITSFKGRKLYFDFHPGSSLFYSVRTEQALKDAKARSAQIMRTKNTNETCTLNEESDEP